MAKEREAIESTLNETEATIEEYWGKIRQALEAENNKLRLKAEEDASQITAKARQAAEQTLARAREEARAESESTIAGAKQEAEQTIADSRNEAEKVRQESQKIIGEAGERAARTIKEVVQLGTEQAAKFAQATSEERDKTLRLLAEVSKTLEQTFAQTQARAAAELERLAGMIAESEETLASLNDLPAKPAEENRAKPSKEDDEAKTPASSKKEPAAAAVSKRNAQEPGDGEGKLFRGRVKVEMVPGRDQRALEDVPEWLGHIPGVRILSKGGYKGANRWASYTLELDRPLPLLKVIKALAPVDDGLEQNSSITVKLK